MLRIFLFIAVLLFVAPSGYCQAQGQDLGANGFTVQACDLKNTQGVSEKEAIAIAERTLSDQKVDLAKHYLKSTEGISFSGEDVWLVTYELKKSGEGVPMANGGQIFVKVNKKTGQAVITYGE